jgi:AcrR family transcriptional regulator
MRDAPTGPTRRAPRQRRSRQTVDAVLDAVRLVLERHGPDAVTTNRIVEAAGVSIGTLYQYFPDKQAIYRALHQRHVDEVSVVIERALADRGSSSLEDFACTLTHALALVHAADPELHLLVTALVPEGPAGFRAALFETFEQVIEPTDERAKRLLFVLPNLIEGLVHGLVQPPAFLSRASAIEASVEAVRAHLRTAY